MNISNHTINSGIVRDILAELAKDKMSNKYLGGGIGIQFFLPQEFHRRTSDIDLDSSEKSTSGSFHKYVSKIAVPLLQRGYSLDFTKQRQTYDAGFQREGHQVVLQIPKRTEKKFYEVKERLEREVANSETLPYAGGKLRVINPNDFLARKFNRVDMFRRQYLLEIPKGMSLEERTERVNIMREKLDLTNLDPEEIARNIAYLRMSADITDILAIKTHLKYGKIDEKYIRESALRFRTKDCESLKKLINSVFS